VNFNAALENNARRAAVAEARRGMCFYEARVELLKEKCDLLKQWSEAARTAALVARQLARHMATAKTTYHPTGGVLYPDHVPKKAAALLQHYSKEYPVPDLPPKSVEAASMSAIHNVYADYHDRSLRDLAGGHPMSSTEQRMHEWHAAHGRGMASFYLAEAERHAHGIMS
jgi:hypothetical protein